MLTTDHSPATAERLAPPMERQQRGFWIALACALVIHSALLLEANHSAPRRAGAQDGSDSAIAVDIVTEADLKSRETVALPPAGATPSPPPQPPQPEVAPQPAPTPPPQPEAAQPAPKQQPEPQPKQETAPPASELALPDLADVAPIPEKAKPAEKQAKLEPPEKQANPTPPEKNPTPPEKKKPAPQARLDLTPPSQDTPSAAPGRNSSFSRPPGITRSGENDEFGRGVIRALRATFPPPAGIYGRVTVRLFLDMNGNLTDVRVVESSGKSNLDQSIVFATKQSNFPLPPAGATVADRTFLISYIYR